MPNRLACSSREFAEKQLAEVKREIIEHAERLIREYGGTAYHEAKEAARTARRHRNSRLEGFLKKVASEIERRARVKGGPPRSD